MFADFHTQPDHVSVHDVIIETWFLNDKWFEQNHQLVCADVNLIFDNSMVHCPAEAPADTLDGSKLSSTDE